MEVAHRGTVRGKEGAVMEVVHRGIVRGKEGATMEVAHRGYLTGERPRRGSEAEEQRGCARDDDDTMQLQPHWWLAHGGAGSDESSLAVGEVTIPTR
ncbi:hypothetical protein SESBI_28987 [Sesbania bispinosa]|nr:hypothetical protein SESBI_28987 [Sesbania bispinosa]